MMETAGQRNLRPAHIKEAEQEEEKKNKKKDYINNSKAAVKSFFRSTAGPLCIGQSTRDLCQDLG
jgi:hypothetical protein